MYKDYKRSGIRVAHLYSGQRSSSLMPVRCWKAHQSCPQNEFVSVVSLVAEFTSIGASSQSSEPQIASTRTAFCSALGNAICDYVFVRQCDPVPYRRAPLCIPRSPVTTFAGIMTLSLVAVLVVGTLRILSGGHCCCRTR